MPETVVLTRFPADDVPLADRLARAGVRTIQLSCLRIEPLVAPATMGDALGMLGPEDRLVFTSRAGVDAARLALPATEVRAPVAAVGPATARACADWGLAAWTPSVANGAALGRELPLGSGEVVLVRGERADRAIVAELARRGATIGELVAYRTVADVQGDVGAARRALLARASCSPAPRPPTRSPRRSATRSFRLRGSSPSDRRPPHMSLGASRRHRVSRRPRRSTRSSTRWRCPMSSYTAERISTSFRRHRRLRLRAATRRLVRETRLDPGSLVLPVFVDATAAAPVPITSLPGHWRWPVDRVAELAGRAVDARLGGLILFGIPDEKDDAGHAAADPLGPVPRALRLLRERFPELVLVADVCLCEYTTHGHCGLIGQGGAIDNDASLAPLADAAVAYAKAGADLVAPSDMLDGRVAVIRAALDGAGLAETAILSYAAKMASAFYGPFRDAAGSAPAFGDRASHQMDPANGREALAEMASDIAEGADLLMVKPAGPNLDVLARARARFDVPLAAYQVSGEYAALHAAADRGWLDLRRAALESLTGIARAGADVIVTYFALEAATWLAA